MTTRASVIAADAIVLLVTWVKTWHTYKTASRVDVHVPLSYLILRDGTIYFMILLALNVLQILVVGVSVFEKLEPVNSFIVTLTPILISRFILNLRDANESRKNSTEDAYDSRFSHPGFRVPTLPSFTDNMGEMLDHSPPHDESENRDRDDSNSPEGPVLPFLEQYYTPTPLEDPYAIIEERRDTAA
ncbi:hypothetical protein NM688_g2035 [Phlebia brevispora]|uniref:Uncharacterized protein n=1 Tax=Phlebia brevispora TaxID=194682 RepID=A0ACC1T9T9_9APHY|nr:hypothetical protein NM688_g2035 [Phlebia brevispora]